MPLRQDSSWCLYVLQCKNKALYTGISNNLPRRFLQHTKGKGARYTRNFGVKRLVYALYGFSLPDAMRAEKFMKSLPPQKKAAFIKISFKKNSRKKH
ncbi:MAG TPA: GIY-YIG nuclease family protein [Candidatus Omnitrophota bacterium]|nr:GIY-YIG nuclease family protein [Candidatus Omnitrophota bacterium]HPT07120.1 GIY-YIG nuclease family protein [Candidatus Omnitrophota bacterium]